MFEGLYRPRIASAPSAHWDAFGPGVALTACIPATGAGASSTMSPSNVERVANPEPGDAVSPFRVKKPNNSSLGSSVASCMVTGAMVVPKIPSDVDTGAVSDVLVYSNTRTLSRLGGPASTTRSIVSCDAPAVTA